jgi:hypothetical protein
MFPTTDVPLVALLPYATVIVFPGDNATFQISVVVSQDDEAWRGLRRDRIFDALVAEIPLTQPWIGSAEATSDPLPFPSIENRWRRVTNGNAPCVLGLVLLGDAAMQTNPTLGRGVSMAFMHAQHLVRELDACMGDPWDLVVRFERWTTEHFGPWFETQVALDEKRSVELAAGASSTEPGARPDPVHGFLDALDALRSDDPLVRVAYDRVYHLIDPPYALFRNRELVKRVAASARRRDWLRSRPAGPDHERFRRILVS